MSTKFRDDLYSLHSAYSRRSLRYYLDNVIINSSPIPRAWKVIREPWQDELLAPKLPAFEYLAGLRENHAGPMSFFDILARGHDKSSLEGRLATGLLLCSKRPIQGYIVAADLDQGRLLRQAMQEECALNPWLEPLIHFKGDMVTGPAGSVEVVPADAGGAFGYRGNLFIFDEMTNWQKPVCKKVYEAVMSGTEKRNPRIVAIISNAGYYGTWQEKIWNTVRQSPQWSTFYHMGQLATWMPPERVKALAALMPSSAEARRVFENHWINAGEQHDYLTEHDCARCVDESLCIQLVGNRRIAYTASIDYGPKRDRTVAMVGHKDSSGRVFIDRADVWEGKSQPGGKVQPSVVRRWITDIVKNFDPQEIVIDPAQMLSEIEWMQQQRMPVVEYAARGGAGNHAIATALRTMICGNAVRWYPGCAEIDGTSLSYELSRLVVKRKEYGFRIDHEASEHDDRAVTLGQLLVRLAEG